MSGYRGRGRGRGAGVAPKGIFTDGVWRCDCSPREPAVHFETKKAGPNQGRWFRTCQKPDGARCGFFLWDDQAQPREQTVLMRNCRSEPDPNTPLTPSKRQSLPPPPYSFNSNPAGSSRKRVRPSHTDSEDYGLEMSDDEFSNELGHIMAEAETPSKAVKTSNLSTPAKGRRKLPWQMDPPISGISNGLQTPQTVRRTPGNMFAYTTPVTDGPIPTPSKTNDESTDKATTPIPYCDTPTPIRFRDTNTVDLVKDVYSLLHDSSTHLNSQADTGLRALLLKYAKNAEGYKRGRDVIRTTVKAKDARITELSFRISTLEAELQAERAMVKHLQWEAQTKAPNP